MADYCVSLFGDFAATGPNNTVVDIASHKAQAVLVCLCLTETVSRSQFVAMLWPDAKDDTKARGSLRKEVKYIRKRFGDGSLINMPGDKLHLNQEFVKSDVSLLLAAAEQNAWDSVAGRLPSGPLLKYWESPTTEFEDWLIDRRRDSDARAVRVLILGAERAETSVTRTAFAEAALRIDPHNEDAACAGINACVDASPTRAVAIQRDLARSLQEDLGETPTAATAEFLSARRQRLNKPGLHSIEKPVLIVSPFTERKHNPEFAFLGAALAEDLVWRLSANKWLHIVAYGMPGTYKPPIVSTNSQLASPAKYSVAGTYQIDGRVSVIVRLSDVNNAQEVWGDKYDCAIGDLPAIQDNLSRQIAAQIEPAVIRAEEKRASTSMPVQNMGLWSRVMRARHLFWRTRKEDNKLAIEILREVLIEAPEEVTGLVTYAFAQLLDAWSGWAAAPADALAKAERAAREAVTAAVNDPWAYFTLGTCLTARGRLEEAIIALETALSIHPTLAAARGEYARTLLFAGRPDAARHEAMQAVSISPRDPHASLAMNTAGLASLIAGSAQVGLDWARRAEIANPHWFHHYLLASACSRRLGDQAGADEKLKVAHKLVPNLSLELLRISHPFRVAEHAEKYFSALF